MKIYFCDGCNESIPLADIQAGQATTIKGKLFCRNCIPVGAAQVGPLPIAEGRRSTHPLLIVVVLGLLGWTVWRELPMSQAVADLSEIGTTETELERQLGTLADDVDSLRNRMDEYKRQLDFQRAALDALRAADADGTRSLDQLRMETERLSRGQADIGELIEKINLGQNRAEVFESRLNVLADKVYAHDNLIELGLPSGTTTVDAPAAEVGSAPEDVARAAEVAVIRRLLFDTDPGKRFDGVHKVGQGRYKEMATDLVGMLRDEDVFVRERAMSVLGDFGHVEATPELLDALSDPLVTIRRTAAETLVRLTGYDPGYDPRGSKNERDRAVERWREWYAKQAPSAG